MITGTSACSKEPGVARVEGASDKFEKLAANSEKENQEFLFTPVGYLNVANHPESKSRPQSWTFEGLIARKYDSIVLKCYKE